MISSLVLLRCELKRLRADRRYLYSLLVIVLLTWDILFRLISGGLYRTAPYSQWSYSTFISMVSPMLVTMIILLCSKLCSQHDQATQPIIRATSYSMPFLWMVRATAVLIMYSTTLTLTVGMALTYYAVIYGQTSFSSFAIPTLVMALPAALFFLGLALVIGRWSGSMAYALIPVAVLAGFVNLDLPPWLDFFGNNMLATYPAMAAARSGGMPIPFVLPTSFTISRWLLTALGCTLLLVSCLLPNHQ
ncbi:MAG: hypothetical protein ACM3ZQ_00635 [Bacillota bacterium]